MSCCGATGCTNTGTPSLRGDLERRARLRRIDHRFAARAVDEQSAQPEVANGAFGFASRSVAVIGIDRGEAMKAAWVARDKAGDLVVHRDDGFVRHAALGVGDELRRDIDDASAELAVADVFEQQRFVRKLVRQRLPAGALVRRRVCPAVTSKRAGMWWLWKSMTSN